MKLVITILEDSSTDRDQLSVVLNSWSLDRNFEIEARYFDSGEDFLNLTEFSSTDSHLFILDIQLNKVSGLDIAKRLRSSGYSGQIIFLTAFREYVFHGYEVHALNFLLKPIDKNALYLCLDEIADTLIGHAYLYRSKQETMNIPYKSILCFSSSLHSVNIMTVDKLYYQYASLNSIIGHLPREFIRVHKCYVVNMAHIYKICGNTITLSNQMKVQIGPSYLKQVYADFATYSSRFDI